MAASPIGSQHRLPGLRFALSMPAIAGAALSVLDWTLGVALFGKHVGGHLSGMAADVFPNGGCVRNTPIRERLHAPLPRASHNWVCFDPVGGRAHLPPRGPSFKSSLGTGVFEFKFILFSIALCAGWVRRRGRSWPGLTPEPVDPCATRPAGLSSEMPRERANALP